MTIIDVPVGTAPIAIDQATVACVYCRATVIPVESFAFLSDTGRLLTAVCPGCYRRTTILSQTWRAHGGQPSNTSRSCGLASMVVERVAVPSPLTSASCELPAGDLDG
jgi:hypothetical protein